MLALAGRLVRPATLAAVMTLVATWGVGVTGGVASAQAAGTNEHVKVIITGEAGGPVFFTGVVNDAGSDVAGGEDAVVDTDVLARGTIFLYHKATGQPSFVPDFVTCLARVSEAGTFVVTGGTGAYAGITGGGTFSLQNGIILYPRVNGQCNFGADPLAELLVINGNLSVALP
jgi:hypothetical protein